MGVLTDVMRPGIKYSGVRGMLVYFSFLIGIIFLINLYNSDTVKLYIDPEGFYSAKLTNAIEKKSLNEKDYTNCLRQLGILVKGRKFQLQQHMVDGYSASEAVEIWREEVDVTKRFCELYRRSIDEYQKDIEKYNGKIDSFQDH